MSLVFPNVTKVKLVDVNPRSEVHGDVKVPALDLRFSVDMPNAVLTLLHPELRELIYEESLQGHLDGIEVVSDHTELRFPELAPPFRWVEEITGYALTVDYGLGDDLSGIQLNDCKLHKQTFHPKKGGTCTVLFTLSCTHGLDESAVGRLGMRVQHDHYIQLTLPEPVVA